MSRPALLDDDAGGEGAEAPDPGAPPSPLLLGSGPSPVPGEVLRALAQPTIGHLDPRFGALVDETSARLRELMRTANRATLALSGTGSAGMEAMAVNFVQPGDHVVCGVHGLFGERMADALARQGVRVERVEAPWGRSIEPERLVAALRPDSAALFVVHGETSTGVCQPLQGLADACHERGALLMIDCVTSLAGQELALDAAGVDVAFAGVQKCLNCPPGLAPFSASERALEHLDRRRERVRSWYLDLPAILAYWREETPGGPARAYHHTAPINMVYALHAALALALAEGLPARWARHRRAHEALRAALQALGLERLAAAEDALYPLLAVRTPEGVDEAAIRRALLLQHGIEISGGLGPLAGSLWRIGVMGVGAAPEPQRRLVRALAAELGLDPTEALTRLESGWSEVDAGGPV